MEPTFQDLPLFLTATAVSLLGTFVGAGGGFLMVPLLRLGFGVPVHAAVACSLMAIFPASTLATLVNLRRGKVALKVAAGLEVPAALAAVGGAALASVASGDHLSLAFGIFVGGLGARLVWKLRAPPSLDAEEEDLAPPPAWSTLAPRLDVSTADGSRQVSLPALGVVGAAAGGLAGLLGIGGGFLKAPALVHVFRLPAATATATSLAAVAVTSGVGALSHYRLGNLDLHLGGVLIAGFLLGALLALGLDARLEDRRRQGLIAFSLLAAGGAMLISTALGS